LTQLDFLLQNSELCAGRWRQTLVFQGRLHPRVAKLAEFCAGAAGCVTTQPAEITERFARSMSAGWLGSSLRAPSDFVRFTPLPDCQRTGIQRHAVLYTLFVPHCGAE
jgi:hypothetical protein